MRYCKCGCRRALSGRQRVWATESCRSEFRRGLSPAQRGKQHPGGLQVSYRKAVDAAMVAIWLLAHQSADMLTKDRRRLVERKMAEALPARQRQRLEKR